MPFFNLDSLRKQLLNDELEQFEARNFYRLTLSKVNQTLTMPQKRRSYLGNGVNSLAVLANGNIAAANHHTFQLWDANGSSLGANRIEELRLLTLLPNSQLVGSSLNVTHAGGYGKSSTPCISVLNASGQYIKQIQLARDALLYALAALSKQTVVIAVKYPSRKYREEYKLESWDIENGQCVQSLQRPYLTRALAVLADGRVAAAESNIITVLNPLTGHSEKTLMGHTDIISSLLVLPNDKLISGSADGTLKIWAINSGQCIKTLQYAAKQSPNLGSESQVLLGLLPDGSLVSGLRSGSFLSLGPFNFKIWDIETGSLIQTIEAKGEIHSLTIHSTGEVLTGSGYGEINKWSVIHRALSEADILPLLEFARKYRPTTLKTLSLAGVKLSEEGYHCLLRLIKKCTNLHTLDITETAVTSQQQVALEEACQNQGIAIAGLTVKVNQKKLSIHNFSHNLLFSSSLEHNHAAVPVFSFKNFSMPIPLKKSFSVDKNFLCPITLAIMFNPVVAADGYTYEEEAIKQYLEKSNASPMTDAPLISTMLTPNFTLRSMIREFLTQHPEYWDETYSPKALIQQALAMLEENHLEALRSFLKQYPYFISIKLGERNTFLLEEIVKMEEEKLKIFLPEILSQLRTLDWQRLVAYKSIEDWLQWAATLCPTYCDLARVFVQALKVNLSLDIPPIAFALYAMERNNDRLFELAIADCPDINQVVDKQGNSLLHLVAQQGRSAMVPCLVKYGVDLKLRNDQGMKAEALARQAGYEKTADLIAVEKIAPLFYRLKLLDEHSRIKKQVFQLGEDMKAQGPSFL